MELENEQEEYLKKIRNLLSVTRPSPVGLPDQLAATMNLQWHRGTQWGVDHAKMFYDEVKEKIDKGEAVCKNEKIRLMWIGRGLWHNTAFYRYFEEKYGAVFTNSMYLSIAADGYIRDYRDNPLRALASRHLYMGYWLRDPEWQLNEAKRFGVHGAVMIVASNCIDSVGNMFIKHGPRKSREYRCFPSMPMSLTRESGMTRASRTRFRNSSRKGVWPDRALMISSG